MFDTLANIQVAPNIEKRKKVIYIAGPYRAPTQHQVYQNIQNARQAAADVWQAGYVALCPHTNSLLMSGIVPEEEFFQEDIELLQRCDAVLMVEGWEASSSARSERQHALNCLIPVFYSLEELDL